MSNSNGRIVNGEPRAVILAGGLGTRLLPYTLSLPKPLVPIGDIPIAEVVIRQLAMQGFKRVTLAVNHQADMMMNYFSDGAKWGLEIDYSIESKRLGTMGPLTLIPDLPENFIVVNGDVLSEINFRTLLESHESNGSEVSVATAPHLVPVDFGVIGSDSDGRVNTFSEKPTTEYMVSIGVYAMSRNAISAIPEQTYFGFDDLILELLRAARPVRTIRFDGFWLDIGRPMDYEKARKLQGDGKLTFFPFGKTQESADRSAI
jgi:NDP-sugar pyrophosphorylase family protein